MNRYLQIQSRLRFYHIWPSTSNSILHMKFMFQGEIVDSIEANIEDTTVRVHEGASELRQAELYKVNF